MRDEAESRMRQICDGLSTATGARITVGYHRNYPVTVNHARETAFAIDTASEIAGASNVEPAIDPMMGGEDFSYMLLSRPGAFVFIGNGDTAGLHHPAYDFNDEVIPHGISYWVQLTETALAR